MVTDGMMVVLGGSARSISVLTLADGISFAGTISFVGRIIDSLAIAFRRVLNRSQACRIHEAGEGKGRGGAWSRKEMVSRFRPGDVVRMEPRDAPGSPGVDPHWASAAKDGVGTAVTSSTHGTSLVWFTLADGVLTEIFYPRIDSPCTRFLGLIATDGHDYFSDEARDAEHVVQYAVEGVPLYRITNSCRHGRYRIEKEVLAHPFQNVVLQRTRFVPLQAKLADYHLYTVLNPHLANRSSENSGWLGEYRGMPMLFARRRGDALALACSSPWLDGSVGFVGTSDGWHDLRRTSDSLNSTIGPPLETSTSREKLTWPSAGANSCWRWASAPMRRRRVTAPVRAFWTISTTSAGNIRAAGENGIRRSPG